MVLWSGALLWCSALVLCSGALLWCSARVLCSGAVLGCSARVLCSGALLGCSARVLCPGALLWCSALALVLCLGALLWCSGGLSFRWPQVFFFIGPDEAGFRARPRAGASTSLPAPRGADLGGGASAQGLPSGAEDAAAGRPHQERGRPEDPAGLGRPRAVPAAGGEAGDLFLLPFPYPSPSIPLASAPSPPQGGEAGDLLFLLLLLLLLLPLLLLLLPILLLLLRLILLLCEEPGDLFHGLSDPIRRINGH